MICYLLIACLSLTALVGAEPKEVKQKIDVFIRVDKLIDNTTIASRAIDKAARGFSGENIEEIIGDNFTAYIESQALPACTKQVLQHTATKLLQAYFSMDIQKGTEAAQPEAGEDYAENDNRYPNCECGWECASESGMTAFCPVALRICVSHASCLGKWCFSPNSTIKLQTGDTKAISELRLGDLVQAMNQNHEIIFTKFLGWLEKMESEEATFIQVRTEDGQVQELTQHHGTFRISNGTIQPVFARELTPDDLVMGADGQPKRVSVISNTTRQGAYSPMTSEGTIVVDGFASSCFAKFPHHLANIVMYPTRIWPRLFLDTAESQHMWGVRPYVELWKTHFPLDTNLYREHKMSAMETQIHVLSQLDNETLRHCT